MTWTDKGFFNLGGGVQAGSSDLTVNPPFELYGEAGSVETTQDVKGGGFFNVGAGYKVWRNLAVGVGGPPCTSSRDDAVSPPASPTRSFSTAPAPSPLRDRPEHTEGRYPHYWAPGCCR